MNDKEIRKILADYKHKDHSTVDSLYRENLIMLGEKREAEISRQLLNELILEFSDVSNSLVELNELKNKFMGIVAHDLRNPLVAMKGFCELMLDNVAGQLNEQQEKFIGAMKMSASDMISLVNNLLDYSAIESGSFKLEIRQHSVVELVRERVLIASALAEMKNITIHEKYNEDHQACFDRLKVGQVVDNLLSNAIKFSNKGKNIYAIVEPTANYVSVLIKDEGLGIKEDEIEHIFDEFKTVSTKSTDGEKCTGLGLNISQKVIKAHGDIIKVRSTIGEGSEFCFRLPVWCMK